MKKCITVLTHMLFWAASTFLFWTFYENRGQMLFYTALTAALAGGCSWLRMHVKKISMFFMAHLAILGGMSCVVLFFDMHKWYFLLLALIVISSGILQCVPQAQDLDEPNHLYTGFGAAVYLVIWFLEGDSLAEGGALAFVIVLFLFKMLYDNLHAADWFIHVRNLSEDEGAEKSNHFSKQIGMLYTGGVGVLLGFAAFISMDGIWEAIKTAIKRLTLYLFSLIPQGEPLQESVEKPETTGPSFEALEQIVQESTEKPAWVEAFDAIAPVFTVIIVIALVIFVVLTIVKIMYLGFYQKRAQEDQNLRVEKLKTEEKVARAKRRTLTRSLESNPEKRIRRIYKKNMKKLGEHTLRDFPYMTPDEQVKKHKEAHFHTGDTTEFPIDDVTEVRDLYEKARYGKDIVTDADVERMRRMM